MIYYFAKDGIVFFFTWRTIIYLINPQLLNINLFLFSRLSHFVSVAPLVSDVIYSQGSVSFEILSGGAKGGLEK